MKQHITNIFAKLTKKQIILFLTFLVAAVFAYFMANHEKEVSAIGSVILLVEIMVLVLATWGMAGHTVMKSLFAVGASLSLLIYIAQTYCEVPAGLRTGDTALMSLVGFGLIYIGIEFFSSLRKEIGEKLQILRDTSREKKMLIVIALYGVFIGLFTWQIFQVMIPIINSLCVYTK